jgi:glycosyltransferase involved in cell wall biosynthesis
MHILYIGQFIGFAGGIERYAYQTAQALREAGFEVDYAGDEPSRDEALFRSGFSRVLSREELTQPDAPQYDLVVLQKLCSLELLKRLRWQYGERLVFVAHDHDLYCMRHHYYTPFGRRNCNLSCGLLRCALCSRISHPRNWHRSPLESWRLLRELRNHRAIVLSKYMRNNLVLNGFKENLVHLVHPFVTPIAQIGERPFMPEGKLRILFLGQLIRGKGCDLLLQALAQLQVPYVATIAGDGEDRPMLEVMARELNISANVKFLGWVTEPVRLFDDCDVLAFPSRWQEPFGLGGLEAHAHGIPAVGFDVGGVGEWLGDGITGLLVPPGDFASFAIGLKCIAQHAQLSGFMGRNAVALVRKQFSQVRFVSAITKMIGDWR